MQVGLACIAIFLVMAALMYSRRISALLALPLMAILIAVAGGIPGKDIVDHVLTQGATKLHSAYTTTMFGAILAELINRHGIAKAMVRWVAEFSGDSPFILAIALTLLTALLFSSLGGLGAVIMVGTVVLPVMLSIGIPAATAGALYLFGISLGGMYNLGNWALYIDVLGVQQPQIVAFVVPFTSCIAAVIVLFLLKELWAWRNVKYALAAVCALAAGFVAFHHTMGHTLASATKTAATEPNSTSLIAAAVVLAMMVGWAMIRYEAKSTNLPALSFLSPAIPLILVLAFQWPIIPAFLCGIAFAVLVTWQKGSVNTLTRSIIDGVSTVAPAVALMIGIGMLLNAVMHPIISQAIKPLLLLVIPHDPLWYIVGFTIMAPLALYRGPLSLFGMGAGLVGLIKETQILAGRSIMGMLMSVGQLQGICDPTNTHNVWIATYLGTDTQVLLRKTILWAWMMVIIGLVLAVSFGYVAT
jgi:H+/gluconate symporter-like permease